MTEIAKERPAAPEGLVYLQDVLDIVKRHAKPTNNFRLSWCGELEEEITELLEQFGETEGISIKPWEYCCQSCNGISESEYGEMHPRLVLDDPSTLISHQVLGGILRLAARGPWATRVRNLIADICLTFKFPAVVTVKEANSW